MTTRSKFPASLYFRAHKSVSIQHKVGVEYSPGSDLNVEIALYNVNFELPF